MNLFGQAHLPQIIVNGESLAPLVEKYPIVLVLLGLMLLDIFTGIVAGYISRKLCSTASFRGMMGKVMILGVVAASMLMELLVPNVPWGQFVSFFFCVTEAISITENAANAGVPIPKQWADALRKAKQEEDAKRSTPAVNIDLSGVKQATIEDSAIRKRGE